MKVWVAVEEGITHFSGIVGVYTTLEGAKHGILKYIGNPELSLRDIELEKESSSRYCFREKTSPDSRYASATIFIEEVPLTIGIPYEKSPSVESVIDRLVKE